ncbi:acetyltransferase [Ligilactobacillus salitolerans]|uniref:Acetyltransferase n=1 Tax=Ligilactobacillus salitolerans TaxID=1808352 RepID=A0A401ISE4_9LACO|nr:GNAT family N-acetyltransferase [Ligilactobacillus salitolerans]GBG94449.1 acetyltransferase [Ligilactobacillus salitolerans]
MSDYRLTSHSDLEQFYQLYLYAFNTADEPRRRKYFFERCKHALIYGIKSSGHVSSGLYSIPFTVDFYGQRFSMNGIGDVATAPEHAGTGGAGTLLQAALDEMWNNQVTLSYLAPFSFAYYRKFGYEQVFSHMQYSLASKDVPVHRRKTGVQVTRRSLKDGVTEAAEFYVQQADAGLKGGLVRDDWWWNYLPLKNNWQIGLAYDQQDQLQGYVIYELSQTLLTVKEILATTTSALQELTSFIFNHKNSVLQINFDCPDPTYHGDLLADPYSLTSQVVPYMMARIVNLKDFLQRYPYRQKGFTPITLPVFDQNLPQNTGLWQISAAKGQVQVDRTELLSTSTASLTIQQLTKILFGTSSPQLLVKTGQVQLAAKTVADLSKIIVNEPPQMVDYF